MLRLISLWFIIWPTVIMGQEKAIDILENAASSNELEQFDNETITEDLLYLKTNPINLNDSMANFTLLYEYDLISPLQVDNLRKYIRRHGSLLSMNELIAVPSFNKASVQNLQAFVDTKALPTETVKWHQQLKNSRRKLILRYQRTLEKQQGYRILDTVGPKYQGDPNKLYLKFRLNYRDNLSLGLLLDKDAGETLFDTLNRPDFTSFHVAVTPKKSFIKQLLIGDYEVKLGQGLLHRNGFLIGKGSDATTVFQKGPSVKPYTSSNEFNFMRGLAVQCTPNPKILLQGQFSSKKLDGRLEIDDSNTNRPIIRSINKSGLHRTFGERQRQKKIREKTYGILGEFHLQHVKIGSAIQQVRYGDSLIWNNQFYQNFLPKSATYTAYSVYANALYRKNYLFGEFASLNGHGNAFLMGAQRFFSDGAEATLLYRHYDKNYWMPYAAGFSEGSTINNEQGLYLGLQFSPHSALIIDTYIDLYKHHFNKYRIDRPSYGSEYFAKIIANVTPKTAIELRTKWDHKAINISNNALPSHEVATQKIIKSRLEFRLRPNDNVYLKSRLATTFYSLKQSKESGYLLFQDVIYQTKNKQATKLYFRLSAFNIPSYNSRIYTYENDVLYNFYIPANFNKGVRYYGMVSTEITHFIKLWLKLSQTKLLDKQSIGSGNNLIKGNRKTDAKLQIQITF